MKNEAPVEAVCERCETNAEAGDELFRLAVLWWNVTKAKTIVSDGRTPIMQSVNVLATALRGEKRTSNGTLRRLGIYVHANHVSHVNPDEPGIAAYVIDEHLLIDGHHRVARCVQLGRAIFPVYILSKSESDSVLTPVGRELIEHARRRVAQASRCLKRRAPPSHCREA